ncbi:MAG: hypothetical protein COB34_05810 [Methylophilaceae bacterium]|nr:MAG: hypothetical protein COB34_05810 [Methylophilaceae bacterium]
MKIWRDLLTTDYGLMSLVIIVAMVIFMFGFAYFIYSKWR